jgi:hypothetical protein
MINAVRRKGKLAYPYRQVGVGWEAICLLFFPLLLRLAFVIPGIAVETQGLVDCVCCEDVACRISFFFWHWECPFLLLLDQAIDKCPSTSQNDWEQPVLSVNALVG